MMDIWAAWICKEYDYVLGKCKKWHWIGFIAAFILCSGSAFADQLQGDGYVFRIDGGPNPRTEYFVKHGDKYTKLKLQKHQRWTSGAKITAHGNAQADGFQVDALEVQPVIEELSTGPKNAIAILVNMGSGTFGSGSVSSVAGVMASMDSLYQESSYFTTSFPSPRVVLVDIGAPVPDCNYRIIADQADALAGDLTGIHNKIYVVPPQAISGCTWLAIGELGQFGNDAVRRSWSTRIGLSAFGHEVGHNKGWHHASTDPENDGVKNSEYGDTSSIMGYCCVAKRFNSFQVARIGWNTPTDIVSSGNYDINDLYSADSGTVIRFPRSVDSDYYLSYRKASGHDSGLSSTYLGGVAIHYGALTGNRSLYIDTLMDGECWDDGSTEVCQIAHTPDNVTVAVNFEFVPPPPPPPPPDPVCGNGIIETGEECDDGNLINGDGCSDTCMIEPDECSAPGKKPLECFCKDKPWHRKCQ